MAFLFFSFHSHVLILHLSLHLEFPVIHLFFCISFVSNFLVYIILLLLLLFHVIWCDYFPLNLLVYWVRRFFNIQPRFIYLFYFVFSWDFLFAYFFLLFLLDFAFSNPFFCHPSFSFFLLLSFLSSFLIFRLRPSFMLDLVFFFF